MICMHTSGVPVQCTSSSCNQARRQGEFEGVRAKPPFDLQKMLYTPLNCILSILPFESGPLVSLLLRITAVQPSLNGCSYSTGVCEFVHGRPARNARTTCLRRCAERTRVITCVNKSLVHALESCPSSEVTPRTCCSCQP